jgi:hypothetical protein
VSTSYVPLFMIVYLWIGSTRGKCETEVSECMDRGSLLHLEPLTHLVVRVEVRLRHPLRHSNVDICNLGHVRCVATVRWVWYEDGTVQKLREGCVYGQEATLEQRNTRVDCIVVVLCGRSVQCMVCGG